MRTPLVLTALIPCLCSATLRYQLKPDVPNRQLEISITLDNAKELETFKIPGWSPGFYVMEKYDSKISSFHASDASGKALEINHSDPSTWTVSNAQRTAMTVTYRVQGDDVGLGFFAASVANNGAYTNGAASFMYVLGRRQEDTSLKISVPTGWKLATAMDPAGGDEFTSENFDEMIDQPIQMGLFTERDFRVEGIPFRAVFQTPPDERIHWNLDSQVDVLKKVSQPAIRLFHGAPFKRYIYFFHLSGQGFQGGLEHRNGTVIAVPNMDDPDISDLASHEFFHAWNVKQIRPVLLGPFDYTQPQRTANLWFAEGVTDYYSKILTYRSGVHDLAWLLNELNDQVTTYQAGKTRLGNTVEDASRAVWENGGFNLGDLDYYNKGLLSGLVFDAKIREVTSGKKSLDDVMRLMFARYRLPNPGYQEDGIKQAINEVAGTDLSTLYDTLIRSTSEMPYDNLKSIGLEVSKPGESSGLALGSYPVPNENADPASLDKFHIKSSDRFVGFGLAPSDSEALVQYQRSSQLFEVTVPVTARKFVGFQLIMNPTPTKPEISLFKGWAALSP